MMLSDALRWRNNQQQQPRLQLSLQRGVVATGVGRQPPQKHQKTRGGAAEPDVGRRRPQKTQKGGAGPDVGRTRGDAEADVGRRRKTAGGAELRATLVVVVHLATMQTTRTT